MGDFTAPWGREELAAVMRERDVLRAEVERLREAIDSALRTTWAEDDEGGWGTSEDRLHADRLTALAALVPHWADWGDEGWDAAGRETERLRARWEALTSDAVAEAAWDDLRASWRVTHYPDEWPTSKHLRAAIRAAMQAAQTTTKEE